MDIDIYRIVKPELCESKLRSRKKDQVLRELVKIAKKSPLLKDIDVEEIYDKLKIREEQGSTGIGEGIAIPHTAVPGLTDFIIVLAVSGKGINFEAIDRRKVHLFALILGPENQPKLHIQLLAQLSHIFKDKQTRDKLIHSRTSLALYENFMMQCEPETKIEKAKSEKQKIVILVIQRMDMFEDIVEYLTEKGVVGATIIESKGFRNVLTGIPLFADFIQIFGERSDENQTIIFAIPESLVENIIDGIEDITGDLNTHSGAMIMVIDPVLTKGSLELI
ncbi:hypothetical protein DRQ33_01800 [bacterium]|nr:MAG: hypothetical protein DRQ33_01800 [bacterium]